MLKTKRPLPAIVRRLCVASPAVAAEQIVPATRNPAQHAYVARRDALVALVLKLLPRAV